MKIKKFLIAVWTMFFGPPKPPARSEDIGSLWILLGFAFLPFTTSAQNQKVMLFNQVESTICTQNKYGEWQYKRLEEDAAALAFFDEGSLDSIRLYQSIGGEIEFRAIPIRTVTFAPPAYRQVANFRNGLTLYTYNSEDVLVTIQTILVEGIETVISITAYDTLCACNSLILWNRPPTSEH